MKENHPSFVPRTQLDRGGVLPDCRMKGGTHQNLMPTSCLDNYDNVTR